MWTDGVPTIKTYQTTQAHSILPQLGIMRTSYDYYAMCVSEVK